MICSQCNNDNQRGVTICVFCNAKLPGVRHSCGFINSITDQFCGGCGEHLVVQKTIFRPHVSDTPFQSMPNFSDNQLVTLLEVQKQQVGDKKKAAGSKQEDINKLFE